MYFKYSIKVLARFIFSIVASLVCIWLIIIIKSKNSVSSIGPNEPDAKFIKETICYKSYIYSSLGVLLVKYSFIPDESKLGFPNDFTKVLALAEDDREKFVILNYVDEKNKQISSKYLKGELSKLLSIKQSIIAEQGTQESAERLELISETINTIMRISERALNN